MICLTNNFGSIQISEEVIAKIVGRSVEGCYGVVGMAATKATDAFVELLSRENPTRGVKVTAVDNQLVIDLFVIVEYGVSIFAVTSSAMDTVRYDVETQTGLTVSKVNIKVEGIRVTNKE